MAREKGGVRPQAASSSVISDVSTWLLCGEIVLLRTFAVYFHHFTPYQRWMNLRALTLGARPAPVFWGVVLADLAAWLGFGLLLARSLAPGEGRTVRVLAAYGAATAVGVPFHLATLGLAERLIRFGQLPRNLGLMVLTGLLASAGMLLVPAAAVTPSWRGTGRRWLRRLVPAGWRMSLLGATVWLLNRLAFFLLALPVGGEFLYALTSTLLPWWLFARSVRWVGGASAPGAAVRRPWVLPAAFGTVAAALLLGLLLLPGPRPHADAVAPPSLVVKEAIVPPTTAAVFPEGAVFASERLEVRVERDPFDLVVVNAEGREVLDLIDGDADRPAAYRGVALSTEPRMVRMIPLLWTGNTVKSRWRLGAASMDRVDEIVVEGNALVIRGRVGRTPVRLRLTFVGPETLKMVLESAEADPWIVPSLSFEASAEEHFLGFGERVNRIDQRGQDVYHLVEENGYGPGFLAPLVRWWLGERGAFPNGELCTYWPVPFYLSSRGYGLLVAESFDPRIEAASAYPDVVRVSARGSDLTVYLFAQADPIDRIRAYTDLTGKPRLAPTWVFLPWKSRSGGPTEPLIREDMEKMRALEIPTSALNVEAWERWRGSFVIDRERYPQIEDLVRQAHERGYKMSFWMFPYVQAEADNPVYVEGVREGYFVKNRVGLPYPLITFFGSEVVIDMTHPEAVAWFQERVASMYRLGFDAHMNDFGESIPPDGVFYNGRSGFEMRNLYPLLYVQAVDEAVRRVKEDYVIYPRPGFTGMQRLAALQWPGDQNTDWSQSDGLPTAVRAMINVSMAGVPVHGSDIGGWHDIVSPPTDKELFLRWAELGAYSPWMRAHGGFLHPVREPWRFDEETVTIYRRLAEDHTRLFPYLYSWAVLASRTGEPIVRHPSLLWPGEEVWYGVEDEYLLGDALLVAPVVEQGATSREVRFPPGRWRHVTTGVVYEEGVARVPAPIGQPPVFLRQGEILPTFTEVFDTLEPASDPSVRVGSLEGDLTVHWFAGGSDEMILFDGTRLAASGAAEEIDLVVEGPMERGVTWRVYGVAQPTRLLLDGRPLPSTDWAYDPATETLEIRLPRQAASRVVVRW